MKYVITTMFVDLLITVTIGRKIRNDAPVPKVKRFTSITTRTNFKH